VVTNPRNYVDTAAENPTALAQQANATHRAQLNGCETPRA